MKIRTTTRARLLAPLSILLLLSGVATAATPMLTTSGVTSATTSSCPTGAPATCSSGWFRVAGAAPLAVHVWSTAGSTATVKIKWRANSIGAAVILKSLTDPSATEVHYICDGVGEYSIDITAWTAGTIKATIDATSYGGQRLW